MNYTDIEEFLAAFSEVIEQDDNYEKALELYEQFKYHDKNMLATLRRKRLPEKLISALRRILEKEKYRLEKEAENATALQDTPPAIELPDTAPTYENLQNGANTIVDVIFDAAGNQVVPDDKIHGTVGNAVLGLVEIGKQIENTPMSLKELIAKRNAKRSHICILERKIENEEKLHNPKLEKIQDWKNKLAQAEIEKKEFDLLIDGHKYTK